MNVEIHFFDNSSLTKEVKSTGVSKV